MMHVEGRCPKGELARSGIMVVLMLGISGWFFLDGFVKYPQKNLKQAIENLPVGWPKVPEEADWPPINPRITESEVSIIREGMKIGEVEAAFGPPGLKHGNELRYFGPAGFLAIKTIGELVKSHEYVASRDPSAGGILTQKIFGVAFLIIGTVLAAKLARMALARAVLTEEGLSLNGRSPITWEEMEALDDSEYKRKAWVYLEHTQGGAKQRVKLDSYRIDTFRKMIGEICARKGFPVPFSKSGASEPGGGDGAGA